MKKKALSVLEWTLPFLIAAWFPFRFYWEIAHYQAHHDDIGNLFLAMISLTLCAFMIVQAVRRRSWILVALCGAAACSCAFFSYWNMKIPFCLECEPLTKADLGFMLKPYAERFGIYH